MNASISFRNSASASSAPDTVVLITLNTPRINPDCSVCLKATSLVAFRSITLYTLYFLKLNRNKKVCPPWKHPHHDPPGESSLPTGYWGFRGEPHQPRLSEYPQLSHVRVKRPSQHAPHVFVIVNTVDRTTTTITKHRQ